MGGQHLGGYADVGLALLTLDEDANGTSLSLHVGERVVLRLREAPTSGFRWAVEAAGEPACELRRGDYTPPQAAGGEGMCEFTLAASKPGNARVSLALQRGWQKNAAPARRFELTVTVN